MTDLFIAWAPHNRRSEQLANAMELELHFVHRLRYRKPLYAPVKYPFMLTETWQLLREMRPRTVFVQNPPPLLPLAVVAFGARHPLKLIVDHHTAAFSQAWAWLGPLRPWIARRAALNLVTNEHWAEKIKGWGGTPLILDDVPAQFPMGETFPLPPGANVAVISSFAPDEPLETLVDAAIKLPNVHFHVTGDKRRANNGLLMSAPGNLRFTGFLPDERYFGLLRSVDAIVVLTTRDHTNQRGGCEAVWLGQPLIISDWPVLQRTFHSGTVHVPNTPVGVAQGIERALVQRKELVAGMRRLQMERRARWAKISGELTHILKKRVDTKREASSIGGDNVS